MRRLSTAIQYEQDGYADVCSKRKLRYLSDLFGGSQLEKVLVEFFEMSELPAKPQTVSDLERFDTILNQVEAAPFKVCI